MKYTKRLNCDRFDWGMGMPRKQSTNKCVLVHSVRKQFYGLFQSLEYAVARAQIHIQTNRNIDFKLLIHM